MHKISIKRIYEDYSEQDGQRILVDRMWPRGISKQRAKLLCWAKEIAPSDELRKRYHENHIDWVTFQRQYYAELDDNAENLQKLISRIGPGNVTLLYASKEPKYNNALALKRYLESTGRASVKHDTQEEST